MCQSSCISIELKVVPTRVRGAIFAVVWRLAERRRKADAARRFQQRDESTFHTSSRQALRQGAV